LGGTPIFGGSDPKPPFFGRGPKILTHTKKFSHTKKIFYKKKIKKIKKKIKK
jgi:hypothetical protein